MLAGDEGRDVVHRSRTVEGVHRDQILELRGPQLLQVFLHAGGLELERARRAPLAIELVGGGIFQADVVDVQLLAGGEAYVLDGLLDDGEGLQPQEVHLDQPGLLDHRALVLGDEHLLARVLIFRRAHRHDIRYIVAPDDDAAGVHARVAHVALQLLGVFQRVARQGVAPVRRLAQLGHVVDGVRQLELLHVRYLVRHQLRQAVRFRQRQLLHARHVLDGRLRRHRAVGDDMRHALRPVFLRHPAQHLAAPVVVEVGIDIGQ